MISETTSRRSLLHMVSQLFAALALTGLTWQFAAPKGVTFWLGLGLTVTAAVFFVTARYQLGRSFSVTPQARQLVVRGVYSRIRNPIYFFSTLMILGAVIAFQKPAFFLIPAVLVPVQVIRARREARVLEAKFGNDYRKYRQSTWF